MNQMRNHIVKSIFWVSDCTHTLLKYGCNDSTFLGCSVTHLKMAPQSVDEEGFVQHQRVLHDTFGSVTPALLQSHATLVGAAIAPSKC